MGQGFTLIELMIVIAIIAILAAVAIPNFMAARDRAKIAAAKEAMSHLRKGLEIYIADSDASTYPTELDGKVNESDWVPSLGPYTNVTGFIEKNFKGNALGSSTVNQSSYVISATAKDRKGAVLTGTESDLTCTVDGKPC